MSHQHTKGQSSCATGQLSIALAFSFAGAFAGPRTVRGGVIWGSTVSTAIECGIVLALSALVFPTFALEAFEALTFAVALARALAEAFGSERAKAFSTFSKAFTLSRMERAVLAFPLAFEALVRLGFWRGIGVCTIGGMIVIAVILLGVIVDERTIFVLIAAAAIV